MGQLAIVNAPSSFTVIWSFIKPWLSKETQEKVDILGKNYEEVLLEMIDEDSLPATLGGKCSCEDTGGCHLSGAGPWLDGRQGWGPKAKKEADEAAATVGQGDTVASQAQAEGQHTSAVVGQANGADATNISSEPASDSLEKDQHEKDPSPSRQQR